MYSFNSDDNYDLIMKSLVIMIIITEITKLIWIMINYVICLEINFNADNYEINEEVDVNDNN